MTGDPGENKTRGVVLAGGESTRFGEDGDDKTLATVGGETILGRTVDVLEAATGERPVVAVRTERQRSTYGRALADRDVEFAFDAPEYRGPLAGTFGAAAVTEARWLFCCGCDMPLLSRRAVAWLVGLARRLGSSEVPPGAVAVEHGDGTVDPLHAVYRRASVTEFRGQLPEAAGPRALLAALGRVHAVPVDDAPADVPVARSTTNVNTVGDLEAVRNATRE